LEDREFAARDFGKLPNGICRIAAPLTHELALTLPHWRECLWPIAAHLAQTFRESLVSKGAAPRTLAAKSGSKRRSVPGPERSPLLAMPRKASQPRLRNAGMAHANCQSTPSPSDRLRDVWRASSQAQAPSLRCVHAQSAAPEAFRIESARVLEHGDHVDHKIRHRCRRSRGIKRDA
jgi:hypothetical protein